MNRFVLKGLRAQSFAVIAIALGFVFLLFVLMTARQLQLRHEVSTVSRATVEGMVAEQLRQRGLARASELADNLANPLYYLDLESIGAQVDAVKREPDVSYVTVFDGEGRIVHDGSGEIPAYGQKMEDGFASKAVLAETAVAQFKDSTLDVAAPVSVGGQKLGGVRIGYSVDSARRATDQALSQLDKRLEQSASRHRVAIVILLLVLLALAALVFWITQRRFIEPMTRLSSYAQALEAGQYDASLPVSARQDELGELERSIARMGKAVREHDQAIRQIAYTDNLTHLPNRLAFGQWLEARLQDPGQSEMALLFIDVDDFKRVNDSYGHDVGDRVLIELAQRINDSLESLPLRTAEVARFGGDEFVLLIEARDPGTRAISMLATRLANVLVDAMSQQIILEDGKRVTLGASIGITLFPDDAASAVTLMKNGDIAMYQAKKAGKHCYRFFEREMDQGVKRRLLIEAELPGAWERGELHLAYQPIFRIRDRKVVGAEALLRWDHPQHGVVSPAVFIEVAEETGLIHRLGTLVLEAAARDAMVWRGMSKHDPEDCLFVSVNLSVLQLRDAWLPEKISEILVGTGLPPHCLHLELTETVVLEQKAELDEMMQRIRAGGVKLWLDDFGTGFSGLSHLRRLSVDGVKIDRTFVADILEDQDDLALIRGIVALASSLDITVVAEGVEEPGQLHLLQEMGCDFAQGFYLGMPVSHEEMLRLVDFRG